MTRLQILFNYLQFMQLLGSHAILSATTQFTSCYGLKIPNRLGKMSEKPRGRGFFDSPYRTGVGRFDYFPPLRRRISAIGPQLLLITNRKMVIC